jgi:hypothetical protein
LITDPAGRPIFDRQIVVGADPGGHVTLINGGQVVKYTCAPTCEAGDSGPGGFFGALTSALTAGLASGMASHHSSGAVEASPNTP